MKKFTLIVILLSLSIGVFAQATPVSDLRVADASATFNINLPVGTKVYNIADGKYWVAKVGVASNLNLTTGAAFFKQLNADFTTFVTLDQTVGQTIGSGISRLAYLWASNIDVTTLSATSLSATNLTATNLTVTNPIIGSLAGNAATVTTNANLLGPVTSTGNTTAITDKAVTLTKIEDIAGNSILGNSTGIAGTPQVISIGSGLTYSGGKLTASGLGGTVTSVSVVPLDGVSGTVATPNTTPAITLTLGDIKPASVAATGTVSGTQFTSSIATGTAPLVVISTTPVANLTILAANISGVVAVPNGGTGMPALDAGSYIIGSGTAPVTFKTSGQVLTDIGAAPTASASLFKVESFSEGTDVANGQTHTLTQLPKLGTSVLVIINGSPLAPSQFSVAAKIITLSIPVYQYDAVTISYAY